MALTIVVLLLKIRKKSLLLNIPWVFLGFFAMGMCMFTAVFFGITVTLKEFCEVFKEFRTNSTLFDSYTSSGFFPTDVTS